MSYQSVRKELRSFLDEVEVVDHHEHLGDQWREEAFGLDLPCFMSRTYLSSDLTSAGLLPHESTWEWFGYLKDPRKEDLAEERWERLVPFLRQVKSTIYYRYLLIALKDLFGMEAEEVDEIENWRALSDKIREANKNPARWAKSVLDRTNIKYILLDHGWWLGNYTPRVVEDGRFVQIVRMDAFILGERKFAESIAGGRVYSFGGYLDALNGAFQKAVDDGAKGVKSGLAYRRTLYYEDVPRCDAEKAWAKGLENVPAAERKGFQDYMMHQVCEKCAEYNLPMQIHTGIQAGNFNTITNSKPTHLTNLFRKYGEVRFDVFHGGYPYCSEAGLMAKYFPNVYIDGCWLAHISPAAYKRALDEWIEIVPSNKIFAWGGDHRIVEQSYASLVLAKDLIAEVLAQKVASGYFSMRVAKELAGKIMGKNAMEMYRL